MYQEMFYTLKSYGTGKKKSRGLHGTFFEWVRLEFETETETTGSTSNQTT